MNATEISSENKLSTRIKNFVLFALQISLVYFFVKGFALEENSGMPQLMIYWSLAALLNFWSPAKLRHPLLIATTAVTIFHALGLISGLIFFGITGAFILTAHLPVKRIFRNLILLAGLAALILIRLQFFYFPRVYAAVPLAATFLMFRFLLYWHELKHETKNVHWSVRLSYLFNPLSAAFPLFPVLDYKTWQRSHYAEGEEKIYTIAFRRIFLGIALMLLFRIFYHYNPNPANIHNAGQFFLYLFLAYIFILRILGMYWFIIGMLGLFGFNLPPVFDQVFFITRFSMIWRKINVYWKEFITKLVYYPVYFKIRKTWPVPVLFCGMISFLSTWFFHNWQFFWIKGSFPFRITDLLYWLILGSVISISLMREEKRGAPAMEKQGIKNTFVQTVRAAFIFCFMCLLWTLWSSETVSEWLHLLSHALKPSRSLLKIGTGFLILFFIAACIYHNRNFFSGILKQMNRLHHSLLAGLLLSPLLILSFGKTKLNENKIAQLILHQPFNQFDQENAEQGYYEQIGSSGSGNPWQVPVKARGRGQWFSESEAPTDDIRMRILKSSFTVSDSGKTFTTNRFGLRGPEITEEKPENIIRIAVLGASYEMGSGVSDEEVFTRMLEEKLNTGLKLDRRKTRIEVLNFSVGAYHLPQYAWLCDHAVFRFQPDIILSFAHSSEERRLNAVTARLIQNGRDLSVYPVLENTRETCGAKQTMSRTEIRNRLYPYNDSLLHWGYDYVAKSVIAHEAIPVWVYMPALADQLNPSEEKRLAALAKSSGFEIMDLSEVFKGKNPKSLQLKATDSHPNAEGHRLIAEKVSLEIINSAWFENLLNKVDPKK